MAGELNASPLLNLNIVDSLTLDVFYIFNEKITKFISPNHNFSYSKTTTELYSKLKTLEDRTHGPLEFEALVDLQWVNVHLLMWKKDVKKSAEF